MSKRPSPNYPRGGSRPRVRTKIGAARTRSCAGSRAHCDAGLASNIDRVPLGRHFDSMTLARDWAKCLGLYYEYVRKPSGLPAKARRDLTIRPPLVPVAPGSFRRLCAISLPNNLRIVAESWLRSTASTRWAVFFGFFVDRTRDLPGQLPRFGADARRHSIQERLKGRHGPSRPVLRGRGELRRVFDRGDRWEGSPPGTPCASW